MAEKAKDIVNVVEVDGKKKRDADVGAELDYEIQQAQKAGAELKELEQKTAELVRQWQKPELRQDFKLPTGVNPANPHAVPDITVIPEFLEKKDGTKVRLREPEYIYRWCRALGSIPRIAWHRSRGYRPLFYDDYIDKDTYCDWVRWGAEGYILNGDAILMKIDRRKHAELMEQKRKLDEMRERKTEEDYIDNLRPYGIQAFRERGGRREFA